ncbi:N-acetylmuramoyl-L-alanine amidase [Rhodococcus globerulus]|uniref:N-acetylmuramoyl-L-alanine amidase n=1 Tax=Rhodococcus globerulus TaxID=33008 RepID=UPI000A92EC40|nr:N-acetylmuramoyl-L-alanine amidase [Rhodococcus globerulus]
MPHRRPKPSFVLGAVAALAVASPFAVYGLTNDTPDVRSANETSSVAVPTQISQVLLASVPDIVIPLKELTGLDLPDINLGDLKALIPTDIALPPGITIPTELLPAPADPAAPTETPVQDEEFPGAVVKQLTRDAPFSMVALTSDTVDSAQSKIRALSEDGIWGPWFSPDAIDAEQATNTLSATEPLYVGLTKAIQILTPRDTPAVDAAPAPASSAPAEVAPTTEAAPAPEGELGYTPASVSKPLRQVETTADEVTAVLIDPGTSPSDDNLQAVAAPFSTGGPAVITRSQWGADEGLRCDGPTYDDGLGGATVHHTAGVNNYTKAESAGIVRSIYAYHAQTLGWCDVGYNVLVDKYGQIFEGRAGGLDKPVQGAHAGGFNENTVGIAMMGDYSTVQPSSAMLNSVGQFLGWRLKLAGLNPMGRTTMYSEGTPYTPYPQGAAVDLPIIFAHRDVGSTACPGDAAYARMGEIRQIAANAANGVTAPANPVTPPVQKPNTPADTVAGGTGSSVTDLVNQVLKLTDNSPLAQKWIAEGGDLGRLGEAITGELQAKFGNLGALFQNGAIYTSPNGGVYTVVGEIFKAWQSYGSDLGSLGLPISDEYSIPDGFRSDFENGALIFNQITGVVTQILNAVG